MCRWLTEWRNGEEYGYLKEPPVHVLQNTLKALDAAFQRFFKKKGGYPHFKHYGEACGLRETDVKCFAVDAANGRIKFPKVGWLRYRNSRAIDGVPKIASIRREADGWYVSVQVEIGQMARRLPAQALDGDR